MRESLQKIKKEYFPPKIIHKYIFSEFIKIFIGSLIMLTGVLLISLLMENMKLFVVTQKKELHIFLFLVYSIPKMVVAVVSPALMFSVCFVVGQFTVNKELVSMMAAGVSFYRAISTILFFGFCMWFIVLIFSEFIVRTANKKAANEYSLAMKGVGHKADMVYQLHIRGSEGFYYVYWYDADKQQIRGGFNYIEIHKDNYPKRVITALNAIYQPETKTWKLENVEEQQYDPSLKLIYLEKFPEKIYSFPESAEYFAKPVKTPEQMNFFELNEEIQIRKAKGMPYGELEVERQAIFANPLMSFVVVIIGSIAGTFTKRSAGISSLAITIGIVIVYYILFSAGKSLGENGGLPPSFAVWFTPTLFGCISFFMYKRFNL